MKKYIITVLSIGATLSAMENSETTGLINTPTPRILRNALRGSGFGLMDNHTNLSEIIGNKTGMHKTSIYKYTRSALLEHNNLYTPTELALDTKKAVQIIESVSLKPMPTKKSKL